MTLDVRRRVNRVMCRALIVAPIVMAATAMSELAYAQTSETNGTERRGYVFVANGAKLKRIGGGRSVLHAGVGMEWIGARGLGIGFEAGPRFEDHRLTRLDDIMLSVDARYHPRPRTRPTKIDPFLNSGLSLGWEPVSDGQHTAFISVGGGLTYWWRPRRGIQFELRDTVTLGEPQTGYHYLAVRVGYSWLIGRR